MVLKEINNFKDIIALKRDAPLILYGSGDAAKNIFIMLEAEGIYVECFCISKKKEQNVTLYNKTVFQFDELENKYIDFNILIAVGLKNSFQILEYIKKSSFIGEVYLINDITRLIEEFFFNNPWAKISEYKQDETHPIGRKLKDVFSALEDKLSKETLEEYIKLKTTGIPEGLLKVTRPAQKQYFDEDILRIGENETFVDIGAFDGDISIRFARESCNKYDKILLFEPDSKSYLDAKRNIKSEHLKNTLIFNEGCYSRNGEISFANDGTDSSRIMESENIIKITTLDEKLKNLNNIKNITYIKMDIEGSEYEAIIGAIKTIKKYNPKLAISIYHRIEDIYEIPLLIKRINSNYKIYIRHYYFPEAIECELVLYAV